MAKKTQVEQVLDLLRERGETGLTPLEALDEIGCLRLAARIADAKETLGPDQEIVTEHVTRSGKTFARYVLRRIARKGPQQLDLFAIPEPTRG